MTVDAPFITQYDPSGAGPWRSIDDKAWITENVFRGAASSEVRVAHRQPDGRDCRGSGGSLANHNIISVEPLTITASLACNHCAWHGFITNGKWEPA